MNTEKIARLAHMAENAAFFCVVAHESYRRLANAEKYTENLPEKYKNALRGADVRARAAFLPFAREMAELAKAAQEDVQAILDADGVGYVPYGQQALFASVDAENSASALERGQKESARQPRMVLA